MTHYYTGDCMTVLSGFDPESIDIVVTSPPYNLGINYNVYNDKISRDQYLDWLESWAREIRRVLKLEGSLFINLGQKPKDPWVAIDASQRIRKVFELQNAIHWIKSVAISDDCAPGHFKPINSKRYLNDCHEYIFHFTKDGNVPLDKMGVGVPYQCKENIGRYNDVDRRDRGNTWFIPYPTKKNKHKQHPAAFPPQLAEMCIRLHGFDATTQVLDPFFGGGSTGIACQRLGVTCHGIEIDPEYVDMARESIDAIAV